MGGVSPELLPTLDIVIPVYNEEGTILRTLAALDRSVRTPSCVLICYDFEEDSTLPAISERWQGDLSIKFVRNCGRGPHAAVMSGLKASRAPFIVVYPADDDYNAGILDQMVSKAQEGNDIVCASRFMAGGSMVGCPWLKAMLVRSAAFSLHWLAAVPTHDPTNGFRLFTRRVIERIRVESKEGFTYSLELLVKTSRLRWCIGEVPARWFERQEGQSRFRVLRWLPAYLRWYLFAFATVYCWRGPSSVHQNDPGAGPDRSTSAA
jgi:dolichol-phosphate mannosyltransferase